MSSIKGSANKPTMEDVAARAGVSRSLVSLVFQGSDRVSQRRRAAVLAAASELGYRPNRIARNLAQGRSMTIGVVIDDLMNPFFTQAIDGMERVATEAGYQLLLANGGRSPERERQAAATFVDLRVDALITLSNRVPIDEVVDLARSTPTVTVGRRVDADRIDSVANDEPHGCRLAIEHLVAGGHRHIVHIDGGAGVGAAERSEGYRAAMHAFGLNNQVEQLDGEFTHEAGRAAAAELLARPELPQAIFAANDVQAAGLIGELARHGVSVPNDLSVVGYDDTAPLMIGDQGLTTIRQPIDEIGQRSAELAIDRIAHPDRPGRYEQLPPTLVVRSTTANQR